MHRPISGGRGDGKGEHQTRTCKDTLGKTDPTKPTTTKDDRYSNRKLTLRGGGRGRGEEEHLLRKDQTTRRWHYGQWRRQRFAGDRPKHSRISGEGIEAEEGRMGGWRLRWNKNGMDSARLAWSRLPNTEDGDLHDVGISKKNDSSGVESLDYEVIENYAYRQDQEKRGRLFVSYQVSLKWFLALLIGIGTGLAAIFINIAVENFAGWKFALTFAIIQKSYVAGLLVYVLINLALVFSSVYIVTHFAPAAAGSGIPEIKGYLNGIDVHGILLFRTLVGKIFGSIGSVGGGLALGKEGPLVHTGACIASLLGQVTCGCAAGVAAAFRAPVGGVLFALEEVTSWWRSQLMWRVFFTSAVVAVVVRTAMTWCKSGKCGHFGAGGFIIWDISE
ncbi:hypothetical protein KSS87_001716 [Heliosperma pusillum]|nr:hypothetical protein KSS87_001716 [Heliosperma pusillum]